MSAPPEHSLPAAPSAADWQRVVDAFDRLLADIATLLQRFEAHGLQARLKDDYLALHALQARTLEQRQQQLEALHLIDPSLPHPPVLPGSRH